MKTFTPSTPDYSPKIIAGMRILLGIVGITLFVMYGLQALSRADDPAMVQGRPLMQAETTAISAEATVAAESAASPAFAPLAGVPADYVAGESNASHIPLNSLHAATEDALWPGVDHEPGSGLDNTDSSAVAHYNAEGVISKLDHRTAKAEAKSLHKQVKAAAKAKL